MDKIKISYRELYERCVLSSIAHAVYTFREPFFSYEQSWDKKNYSFCVGSTRGTISFDDTLGVAAGAVRDDKSERIKLYPQKNAYELFEAAPAAIIRLAKDEALEYLYDTIGEVTRPVATVALWNDGNDVILSDERSTFVGHGGEFILLLCDLSVDLGHYWREQYSLSDDELALVGMLTTAVLNGQTFTLPKNFKKMLKKSVGLKEGLEALDELGIDLRKF